VPAVVVWTEALTRITEGHAPDEVYEEVRPRWQADHSEKPEQALRKACSAWVVNNGCINEFIKSLYESGYFLILVPTDVPTDPPVTYEWSAMIFRLHWASCNYPT
jgi:hypothetical protein